MGLFDTAEALLKLGIPMLVLSWFMFSWLYSSGDIDRTSHHKVAVARLKKLQKRDKSERSGNRNYVFRKWSWFGGGFYGLAALWTFAVIEFFDVLGFLFKLSSLAEIFDEGLRSFVMDLLIGQLSNALSALVWFNYWPAESTLVWVFIAYLGYRAGVELAKRDVAFSLTALLDFLLRKRQSSPVVGEENSEEEPSLPVDDSVEIQDEAVTKNNEQ